MDFTSTGGDAAMQYVRAFSSTDDFLLTGLVITQQVGENPWHHCPSPQFVVTLDGSLYIRTSDGEVTTFSKGDGGPCNQLVLGVAPKVFPAAGPGACDDSDGTWDRQL
ncbi:hypothetical protein EMIHUDRAFT_196792 [Emiliania huxleyi CCMP1516]|uniref:Cupin type-1 domain-containing protein n=2 Tax=Emiliania huxleyi TaxID=2903 RepID=A0A0D3J4Q6_EMIH1|nr:hypothetical protein EMIHUDRAFT_196792 [Emiliania huxleyi CCMP1516]EOD18491.1 hypothetical protein EMIHUDRAFT_196792 [Emiliania huxleyi CCMP1516]|eukprot:XP_005770920.1 hypothetical protein EMIHUDRAFT_196792 [Emiliania huxleyi CCMP1516]